jgi:predicted nucleotidyltransferase
MDDPYEGFYIREISRDLDMSPMTVKRCLDGLLEDGLVVKYRLKSNILFKVDLEDPSLRHMKISYNLRRVREWGIVDRILKNGDGVISVTLYGSYATGTNDGNSDLDILIIASTRKVVPTGIFSDIGKEVSLVQMRPDEWESQYKSNKAFYNEVVRDGIPIHGRRLVSA